MLFVAAAAYASARLIILFSWINWDRFEHSIPKFSMLFDVGGLASMRGYALPSKGGISVG
jgi:hypothetical protein